MELGESSAVVMEVERRHYYVALEEEKTSEIDTQAAQNAVPAHEVSHSRDPGTMDALPSVYVLGLLGFPVCYTGRREEAAAVRDSG